MDNFVVISGCSSGGKSTLLAELSRRGFAVIEEPGRRIVRQELETGGSALPWVDPVSFLRRAIEVASADRIVATRQAGWVFFDRGIIDAVAGLQHLTRDPGLANLAEDARYHEQVFLAPPWLEIYTTDPERRHHFEEAVREYERLAVAYAAFGYKVTTLPKVGVSARADFLLTLLRASR